jgi:RNA polymerase sigma-70 factor (ECF subfamily)
MIDARADREIVTAVLAGQRDDFATLIQRHRPAVFRLLYRMTGSTDQADELTQAVFVRVYFALPKYDSRFSFGVWVMRVAFNYCINERRKRRWEELVEGDEDEANRTWESFVDANMDPAVEVERRERDRRLWACLDDLPEDHRQIVVLRHLGELSYQEICDATGLPMGTVKSRLARARSALADSLGPEFDAAD